MPENEKDTLGLFGLKDEPDVKSAWLVYDKGLKFNNQINLDDTVKSNENF